MRPIDRILLAAAVLACAPARAQELPQLGRYLPLYPGMYFHGGYAHDERDASFDQRGVKRDTAAPNAGGETAFPERTLHGSFLWHFPLFESYGLLFVSGRTHFARVSFSYTDTSTTGALAAFAADPSDDNSTEADKLENEGSGNGDLVLEYGSYLIGSPAPQWRAGWRGPFALRASGAASLPFGVYNRDAPISAGSNTAWVQGRIGAHYRPWPNTLVDAGAAYREYFQNYDAAFGRTAPTEQGDDKFADVSVAQRVLPGLYLGGFASRRVGAPNMYENPRFAPNAPPPTATTSMAPAPGNYFDGGTALTVHGVSVSYFVAQRWLAALHYARPAAGRSGEFDLPYNEHSPAGCKNGATNCTTTPAGVVRVDGQGAARSYASDRLMLTVTYNFGQGDAFTCTGCEQ
jgi:hypothetical protein